MVIKKVSGILLLAICVFIAPAQAEGDPFAAYKLFDQVEDGGWRELANDESYLQAGELIDQFLLDNDYLMKWQLRNLYFHAGQMYALAGESDIAVQRLNSAIYENQPVDYPILWNAYIRATIAFLESDKVSLIEMRDKIETGPKFQGVTRNLDVVNRLLQNYGKTYAAAFLLD